ncbi:hypothetical protein CDAR_436271 [Caerostris darwini]|uniref:Uncharacterized protein n=1 Tax=Caerostris darwini TaxID=1538125 RepID=A0AAV4R7X5_9ARAC|nr:hypothetical protein CDAR_436271 [Caerostris darwini]
MGIRNGTCKRFTAQLTSTLKTQQRQPFRARSETALHYAKASPPHYRIFEGYAYIYRICIRALLPLCPLWICRYIAANNYSDDDMADSFGCD